MPRIFHLPPDPGIQFSLDHIRLLREEQIRAEQERAQEREAQKQRAIIAAGAGVGALVAIPAAIAAGTTTVAGSVAAGVPLVTSSLSIPTLLSGAAIGAQVAGKFATGDIAGGVTTAAGAARGIIQSMDDQQFFGGSLSKAERAEFSKRAIKAGTTVGKLKQISRQTGQLIPELLQIMEFEQADDKRVQGMLDDAGILLSADEFSTFAGEHPQGRMGAFFELQGEVSQFEAQAAGQKKFAQDVAESEAAAQNAARRVNMELLPNQREVSAYSADRQEILDNQQLGITTLEEASQQLRGLKVPQATWQPRKTPLTAREIAAQQSTTIPIIIDDQIVGHAFGTVDRDGTLRIHDPSVSKLKGVFGIDFGTAMNELNPMQQQTLMSKAAQDAFLGGDTAVTADEAAIRAQENYNALQRIIGAEQGGTSQLGDPGSQIPTGIPRAMQTYAFLSQMVSQKPMDRWSDQELEQVSGLIDQIIADIEQSGSTDPQVLLMINQVIEFKELMNATRNR